MSRRHKAPFWLSLWHRDIPLSENQFRNIGFNVPNFFLWITVKDGAYRCLYLLGWHRVTPDAHTRISTVAPAAGCSSNASPTWLMFNGRPMSSFHHVSSFSWCRKSRLLPFRNVERWVFSPIKRFPVFASERKRRRQTSVFILCKLMIISLSGLSAWKGHFHSFIFTDICGTSLLRNWQKYNIVATQQYANEIFTFQDAFNY